MGFKVVFAIFLATLVTGSAAFAGDASPQAAEAIPFMVSIEFTAEQIIVTALDGGGWALEYGSHADGNKRCYVSPGQVSGDLGSMDARQYCFGVEFGDEGIMLTSVRGTNWRTLGYSCGDTSPCVIVVTENGVTGR